MSIKSVFDYLPKINADTAEEMAKQAGLDFNAIKVDIHYKYKAQRPSDAEIFDQLGGKAKVVNLAPGQLLQHYVGQLPKEQEVLVPDKVAIVREEDGSYLGTVGRRRGIVQYRDVMAFTESLVADGDAEYVTAGAIGNGQQAYLVMKTNNTAMLGVDDVECYFYVTTSHDSTRGLEIVPCALRKVNGTVLTDNSAPRIRFRHSSRVEDRIKRAKASVDKVNAYFATMEDSFRLLRGVKLNTAQFDLYIESLFPDPEERPKRAETIREDITAIYQRGAAQQLLSTKGTMLGAYFAVVEWVDKVRQQKTSKVRPNEYDAKLHSLLEGSGAQSKSDAYAFALDMARQLKAVSFAGSGGTNDFAEEK